MILLVRNTPKFLILHPGLVSNCQILHWSWYWESNLKPDTNLPYNISTSSTLSRNLFIVELRNSSTEATVVRIVIAPLFFCFFQQPCSVSSKSLVSSWNIILKQRIEEWSVDAMMRWCCSQICRVGERFLENAKVDPEWESIILQHLLKPIKAAAETLLVDQWGIYYEPSWCSLYGLSADVTTFKVNNTQTFSEANA